MRSSRKASSFSIAVIFCGDRSRQHFLVILFVQFVRFQISQDGLYSLRITIRRSNDPFLEVINAKPDGLDPLSLGAFFCRLFIRLCAVPLL